MEKYKDLLPSSDIESSRDHYGLYHSRDFYKGKSLNFANQWAKGTHYFDDEYITDFVAYKGTLLACKRSHLSSEDNEPKLIYDSVNDIQQAIGVDSPFWDFVLAGTPGATGDQGKQGQVYVPKYSESTGDITWTISDTPPSEIEAAHVKGEKGDKGNGITSIKLKAEEENQNVYTITYDNGQTFDFSVPNGVNGEDGRGISKIIGPVSDGLVDTYTIKYSDDTSSTFTVVNGRNGKDGAPGSDGRDGAPGKDGKDGKDGNDGKAATIRIESVETGTPGSNASVINVGTASEAAFKFIIPRGERGKQGPRGIGEKGEPGEQGPEGKRVKLYRDFSDDTIKWGYDGEPISEWTVLCYMEYLKGVSVVDVDITDDAHLKVTLSSGHYTYNVDEDGNPIKDENGNIIYDKWVPDTIITKGKAAATLTAGEVTMLDPNSDPYIENVGTIKDPIWNISIPRGYTGEHAVHVGPEDPVTFKNNHLDDKNIQAAYKNAEDMIWVDTTEDSDFDHINSIYHGYKEAGGLLPFETFKQAFANLASVGLNITIVKSFEDLGEPDESKTNQIWLVPSDDPSTNDLYIEYICIKDSTSDTYVWEKWGSQSTTISLDNYYTKDEVDELLQDVSSTIWIPL